MGDGHMRPSVQRTLRVEIANWGRTSAPPFTLSADPALDSLPSSRLPGVDMELETARASWSTRGWACDRGGPFCTGSSERTSAPRAEAEAVLLRCATDISVCLGGETERESRRSPRRCDGAATTSRESCAE